MRVVRRIDGFQPQAKLRIGHAAFPISAQIGAINGQQERYSNKTSELGGCPKRAVQPWAGEHKGIRFRAGTDAVHATDAFRVLDGLAARNREMRGARPVTAPAIDAIGYIAADPGRAEKGEESEPCAVRAEVATPKIFYHHREY